MLNFVGHQEPTDMYRLNVCYCGTLCLGKADGAWCWPLPSVAEVTNECSCALNLPSYLHPVNLYCDVLLPKEMGSTENVGNASQNHSDW